MKVKYCSPEIDLRKTAKITTNTFPLKFEACGKGDMTAVKQQELSKDLTCYFLMCCL
jgi:hypothetical protein